MTVVGWGANQFAPLVQLYRQRLDVSPAVAEAIFGLYALGLVPGLLVAGPLSDRIGRRPTVVFAVALSMLAGGVLMLGLGLVTVGTLASAGVAALGSLGGWQAVLALANGVEMGCGYGVLMVFGLGEVQRLAPAEDLAGMTAVFPAFTYLGFAAPYLPSSLKSVATPSVLLLGVAGLAVATSAFTLRQAGRTASGGHRD
jgi:MFS family permease